MMTRIAAFCAFVSYVILSSTVGFAAGEPLLYKPEFRCPETHPLIQNLLNEIRTFKKDLEGLNCKEVAADFDKITQLLDQRKGFLKLILPNEGTSLSAEDTQKIQEYSASVTEQVGILIGSMSNAAKGEGGFFDNWFGTGGKCKLDKEVQVKGIEKLTAAAYEATSLLSKVAGPYGVPLQVGVGVVSGMVQGLKSYSEISKNIDFYEGDDGGLSKRQFYENAVCMMIKIDSDINRLLNPKRHLAKLMHVRNEAQKMQEMMSRLCPECDGLAELSKEQRDRRIDQLMQIKDPVVQKLSPIVLRGQLDFAWLEEEIEKFEELVNFGSNGIGAQEAHSARMLIRDFLYKTATKDFLNFYLEEGDGFGSDFEEQIQRFFKFYKKELKSGGFPKIDLYKIDSGIQAKVEQAVIDDGDFTHYGYSLLTSQAKSALDYYSEFLYLYQMNQSIYQFSTLDYEMETWLADLVDAWKLADSSLGVVSEYCNLFKRMRHYNNIVKNRCENQEFIDLAMRVSLQSFHIFDLIEPYREDIEGVRGPMEFHLQKHYDLIQENKSKVLDQQHYVLALEGVGDMQSLIAKDTVEKSFGSYDQALEFKQWHKAATFSMERLMQQVWPPQHSQEEEVLP